MLITLYFVNVKNWMIYYKFNHQISMIGHQNNNDNFFIKNNEKWGNLSIVLKKFGSFHLYAISIFNIRYFVVHIILTCFDINQLQAPLPSLLSQQYAEAPT